MIIPKNAEKKQVCEDYVCSPNAHDHAHTYADGATRSHANDHGGRAAGKYNGDKFDAKNAAVKSKIANDEEGGFASKNLTRKLAAQTLAARQIYSNIKNGASSTFLIILNGESSASFRICVEYCGFCSVPRTLMTVERVRSLPSTI